ncbi:MAG: adenylate/guanylate cyclase domain-containing protein [Cyanobacteria bacterium P01_G01_bin.54]
MTLTVLAMADLKLHLHIEGNAEQLISVSSQELIIGRLPECDLCLPFSEVSRNHSRIFQNSEGNWCVEDLGSTNGTIVNQTEIKGAYKLNHSDAIQIGDAFLLVSLMDEGATRHSSESTRIAAPRSNTILRSAEELQQQWLRADSSGSNRSQQRAIARLEYLVEISKSLSSAESIDDIFNKVQSILFEEIAEIQRLALLVNVQGDGQLRLIDAATRQVLGFKDTQNHDWISQSICNRVFKEKIAIKTLDAQADERFEGEQSILAKGIRGAMAVPLWDTDKVVGVLYADASLHLQEAEAAESEEDLSFFSTIANLVAYSVQRWLLRRELQGQERIRHQLERYHSPAVVQQLINAGELAGGRIEPREADISVIFADLVGFSSMSERMTPQQIAQLLDRFFEEMLQFVFHAGGTLDKFIGDCIMAFFGAPEPQQDHADRAVYAALSMLKHLDTLNAANAFAEPLQIRVAISSGKAVVGDVGSSQRVDYTVLGEPVNVAARLEDICAAGECMISAATYERLSQPQPFMLMGQRSLKGFERPLDVYQTRRCHDTTPLMSQ